MGADPPQLKKKVLELSLNTKPLTTTKILMKDMEKRRKKRYFNIPLKAIKEIQRLNAKKLKNQWKGLRIDKRCCSFINTKLNSLNLKKQAENSIILPKVQKEKSPLDTCRKS